MVLQVKKIKGILMIILKKILKIILNTLIICIITLLLTEIALRVLSNFGIIPPLNKLIQIENDYDEDLYLLKRKPGFEIIWNQFGKIIERQVN